MLKVIFAPALEFVYPLCLRLSDYIEVLTPSAEYLFCFSPVSSWNMKDFAYVKDKKYRRTFIRVPFGYILITTYENIVN